MIKYVEAEILKRAHLKESLHGPVDFPFAVLSVYSLTPLQREFTAICIHLKKKVGLYKINHKYISTALLICCHCFVGNGIAD